MPGFRTLGQLLQALSSLYVREYGPQQLSSLSFRGTGSSHTAVLWQGININSPTLGMSDLGTLPVLGQTRFNCNTVPPRLCMAAMRWEGASFCKNPYQNQALAGEPS
ncbi:MAG: TonB-dependent receptor plug domain-containing protein [Microscillaceae bacterium]|nr:TonB-dependent receptor plug domain-containing protein [Microscillaceae bacterium]